MHCPDVDIGEIEMVVDTVPALSRSMRRLLGGNIIVASVVALDQSRWTSSLKLFNIAVCFASTDSLLALTASTICQLLSWQSPPPLRSQRIKFIQHFCRILHGGWGKYCRSHRICAKISTWRMTEKNGIQEPCGKDEEWFANYTKTDNCLDKNVVGDPSIIEPQEEKVVSMNWRNGLNENILVHIDGLS